MWIYSITSSSAEAANPWSLMAFQDFILLPYNCSLRVFSLKPKKKTYKIKQWISYIKEQHCQHNWYDKTGLYQNVNFCIVLAATHTHTLSFFSNGQYHSISECALWDVSSKCASKKLSKEFQKKKCILLLQTQQIY